MKVRIQDVLVFTVSILFIVSCEHASTPENIEGTLQGVCEERGDQSRPCERLARLRSAALEEAGVRESQSEVEAFRTVLGIAARAEIPELVCKTNIVGGAYCLRATEIFALYESSAAKTIGAELAAISAALGTSLQQYGLVFCPDGSTRLVDVEELSNEAFFLQASSSSPLHDVLRPRRTTDSADRDRQEREFLERVSNEVCAPDEGTGPPFADMAIPEGQESFSSCMASSTESDTVIADAIALGEAAMACVSSAIERSPASDNPLASEMEDLSTLMDVAGGTSTTSKSSFDENGNIQVSAEDSEGNTHTLNIAEDGSFTVTDEAGDITASGTMADEDFTEIADGEGPFAAVGVGDDGNIDVHFDDGTSTEVDPETGESTAKDEDGNEVPELEDLGEPEPSTPPDDDGTMCAPDDIDCQCGGTVDLAMTALGSCMAGTSQCQNILSAYGCCKDLYAGDPLIRVDPTGDFVCEESSDRSADAMLYCAEQCKDFIGEGCMDWCLNGLTLQTAGAAWMDNICLYVDGLECPLLGMGAGFPGTDGGLGLGTLPEAFDDPGKFNGFFGSPDASLFDGLIIGQPK